MPFVRDECGCFFAAQGYLRERKGKVEGQGIKPFKAYRFRGTED